MKINYKGTEIQLKNGMRTKLLFDRLQSQMPEGASGGLTTLMNFFWCCVHAAPGGGNISYDDLIDWVDENEDVFNDFQKWIAEQSSMVPKKN